jgi:hypothetical protein
MKDKTFNRLAFVLLAALLAVLCGFVVALKDSHAGEIAGALGNILGGTIGALGSAAAVYIMLKRQRDEEAEKVSAAVLREVVELSKSPIGQLGACAGIQTGQIRCPKSELGQLFVMPKPIIYPAVADRISRLPRPTLVVTFYTQLQETQGIVELIAKSAPTDVLTEPEHIQVLADLLISQCQLAKLILESAEPAPEREASLVAAQRAQILETLDQQLSAAKALFPDAESFQQLKPVQGFSPM